MNRAMPRPDIHIAVDDPDSWPRAPRELEELGQTIRGAISAALAVAEWPEHMPASVTPEISVTLSGDERVRQLNREWRGKDRPTNILSFPAPSGMPLPAGEPRPLGDLVLAGPVVRAEARAAGVPLAEHLAWLVIHGMLHLLGYDHQTDRERAVMEELERRALKHLDYPCPHGGAGEAA